MESGAERKPRVVLVDDYPVVLAALAGLLQPCCDVVASVSTGADAVEAVTLLRPDVLVADLMMPGMNGLEVCRRVKQLRPETAVIIVTASDEPGVRTIALQAGASAFMAKYLAAEELLLTVQQLFAETQKSV
jgi:CheY-like chemotaxis protein